MSFADFDHAGIGTLDIYGPHDVGPHSRVVIALHGSGGNQEGMALWCLRAVEDDSVTILAPGAAGGGSWWRKDKSFQMDPNDGEFVAAIDANIALVEHLLDEGVPARNIFLVGFSQGACLALEVATEMSDIEFGLVLAMSGGLLGTIVEDAGERGRFAFATARFHGNPIVLSVHRDDHAVPLFFVRQTRDVLAERGANVTLRVEPSAGHQLIPEDRIVLSDAVRAAAR